MNAITATAIQLTNCCVICTFSPSSSPPPFPLPPQRKRKQKDDQTVSSPRKTSSTLTANGTGRSSGQARKANTARSKQGAAPNGARKAKRNAPAVIKDETGSVKEEQPDSDEDELLAATTRSSPASDMLFEPIYAPKRTANRPTQRRRKKAAVGQFTAAFELNENCPSKLYDDPMTLELRAATARPISNGVLRKPHEFVQQLTRCTLTGMRSRSNSPFMGMAYQDHDYGGYTSKNASPSPPPGELVDCGQCFQCLSAKSTTALELDLDTLASKPVVVLKVSAHCVCLPFCVSTSECECIAS